jgi:acyl-CoA thioesterase FadM
MNLWFRLIWALLRSWRLPHIALGDSIERRLRVWPGDLDINGHMNNGRYLTVVDLMLVELFVRTGFAQVRLKAGWRPMSGGAFITYRKGLQPAQRYRLRFKSVAGDEVWNLMRFEFLRNDGTLCAAGYMKGAAVGRGGLVTNQESHGRLGKPFKAGEPPIAVLNWLSAERSLVAEASS